MFQFKTHCNKVWELEIISSKLMKLYYKVKKKIKDKIFEKKH